MRWESKRPNEARTYRHDWTDFLAEGDTIAGAVVDVAGAVEDSQSNTVDSVTVKISGGTAGTTATVTMTITTAAGEIETEVFTIAITTAEEPLTVEEAKEECNVHPTDTTWDAWFARNLPAARAYVENRSDNILMRRSFTEYRDSFDSVIKLYRRPVFEITSIDYLDETNTPISYPDFIESLHSWPVRVYPSSAGWPAIATNTEIGISYVAGYAPGEEPEELMRAIRMLIATWFVNRESVHEGLREIPHGVDALCDQKRGEVV